jgi:hypothetical protein
MKNKSNIWDIYKNKGQWDIRPVMAFLTGTTFSVCGILDCSVKGVEVNEAFYWVCATIILGLIASDTLAQVASIKTGRSTIEQNKNNFDQQVNNIEQEQNNNNVS